MSFFFALVRLFTFTESWIFGQVDAVFVQSFFHRDFLKSKLRELSQVHFKENSLPFVILPNGVSISVTDSDKVHDIANDNNVFVYARY